ncbi:MAG TPA: glutamyl-tRNA reductase [Verrucomicrobiae bacterium]|jgi:glutamyl-tRNA reductase|nr:glutamyl-tRNA reductase [Verrucomicrobiae bacterium]
MTATLFVAGMTHRTAPVEVREALALEEDKLREVLAALGTAGPAAELMILSTCNRVEVYGVADAPGEARAAAFRALGAHRGVTLAAVEVHVVTATQEEAVRHAFRVAASLDSLVVGEPQILGQVKDAFALAQACRTVGPVLSALMSQAFSVAKRVRTETEVGRLAVSVSSTAVELARKIFGSLEGKGVLLLGAGEMAEHAARLLMEAGAAPLYVANRTAARARDLAEALAGTAVAMSDVPAVMARVDVVIAATAAPEPVVRVADARAATHARGARPLFLIDLGVPRNVDAAVNDLDGVFCYDVDDLQQVVEANLRERQREAQRAEFLVEREVTKFLARLRDVEVVPTIVSLRERLEAIRRGELDKALARLPGASEDTRQVLEALSQSIVNKVLHTPIEKLRDSSRAGHGRRWIEVISEVFGLRPGDRPDR